MARRKTYFVYRVYNVRTAPGEPPSTQVYALEEAEMRMTSPAILARRGWRLLGSFSADSEEEALRAYDRFAKQPDPEARKW